MSALLENLGYCKVGYTSFDFIGAFGGTVADVQLVDYIQLTFSMPEIMGYYVKWRFSALRFLLLSWELMQSPFKNLRVGTLKIISMLIFEPRYELLNSIPDFLL